MGKMKNLTIFVMIALILAGCKQAEKEQLRVYSFAGANENFTISNGVVVLHDSEEIFDGGKLDTREFFQ